MMIKYAAGVIAGLLMTSSVIAGHDDAQRIDHYEALPAESLEQALTNLDSHGRELAALIAKGTLDTEDMVKIHELTYTLENALERLRNELEQTADVLEEVHLGSETMDQPRVMDNARRYLDVMNQIID